MRTLDSNLTKVEHPHTKETGAAAPTEPEKAAPAPAEGRRPWRKPEAKPISRFSILSLGPTPGSLENFTFSYKSL